jgi:hypothetical protein
VADLRRLKGHITSDHITVKWSASEWGGYLMRSQQPLADISCPGWGDVRDEFGGPSDPRESWGKILYLYISHVKHGRGRWRGHTKSMNAYKMLVRRLAIPWLTMSLTLLSSLLFACVRACASLSPRAIIRYNNRGGGPKLHDYVGKRQKGTPWPLIALELCRSGYACRSFLHPV